ncbi:sigma-54-dependent Fis family transcriptional regulator [Rhodoferax sp.]|uniref:sigma-54-dependent Fis family transcriptional regulator n=1 Tax=Rhodoferax sp. TaxID=50421 RepID=UPI002634D74C|nr:sigma-54-dependent Fis family transcriptional regulator [Rhodoferax sp.]MDD2918383.1 sigma-54-dependent Fis family transcriptional regulator [Rhodoferax sp.]
MRTPPSALALSQARQYLLEYGDCPTQGLDTHVARSWQRSLAAGLLPDARSIEPDHASAADLGRIIAGSHELLAHSCPVMEVVFEQVRDSQGMVILAHASGTLMHTLGSPDFLQRAQQVALSCGASWLEQHRGTNAIGTALAVGGSIEIHGGEHFLQRNEFLTCTAAPIMSATGSLLGILDISGDHRSGHPHTYGLANMAARLIENQLIAATSRQHIRLHLHGQREGIGTVAEGIVVISGDGWLVGGNRAGLEWLSLTHADVGAVKLQSLLDVPLNTMLAQHQLRPDEALRVHRRDGQALFALLKQDTRTTLNLKVSPDSGAQINTPGGARADPSDALAQLDTGDLRWRSAADKARRVADKPIPLLIQGESGVGKELFARAVHDSGPRRGKPFVAINCAAVPENLVEAELFGYAPGAFTGARRDGSLGRLREAQGGTLFLDEIGDMPLLMQMRLLRVLQERQVIPLGGGPSVPVDFALMCATHCKLREAAEQGHFRSDLYYRINGLTVQLPPLRERTDFAMLTQRLLLDLNPQRSLHVVPELLTRLSQHPWPGNLRQYANALRTASAMLEPHEVCIDWVHLSDDLLEDLSAQVQSVPPRQVSPLRVASTNESSQNLAQLSQTAMRLALENSGGNMSQAARQLGISRQTLYRKLNA